ncbi:hypothetical protein GGX14DRAFT_407866 [Mycena pura]|uniref:Uncharacterized protein n=1 Tax=Mycena pura TaxID=153505 RepID=A0AAD6UM90_9AGAR|nr:hypothetical protein GGX14DRAFT_407866 [Mycena pura]
MFGFGQQESRKFIDLLLQVTNNKWTNIDANKEIKVGDFGQIDRATGELQIEGNLYEHPDTQAKMDAHPVRQTVSTEFEKYVSEGVKELSLAASADAKVEPIVDGEFEGKFAFQKKRGALLVITSPRIQSMHGFPTSLLLDDQLKGVLKDRVICTDVVSCPGFFLYLGNSGSHVFNLSLKADLPVPVAPGVKAGGSLQTGWKSENTQGLVKKGMSDKGEYVYFPLYSLKRVSWGRVSSVLRGEEDEDEASLYVSILTPPDPWLR